MTTIYLPAHLMQYKCKLSEKLTITYEILEEVEILEGEYIFIEDAGISEQFDIFEVIYNEVFK